LKKVFDFALESARGKNVRSTAGYHYYYGSDGWRRRTLPRNQIGSAIECWRLFAYGFNGEMGRRAERG